MPQPDQLAAFKEPSALGRAVFASNQFNDFSM